VIAVSDCKFQVHVRPEQLVTMLQRARHSEVTKHLLNSGREALLAVRVTLDSVIQCLETDKAEHDKAAGGTDTG